MKRAEAALFIFGEGVSLVIPQKGDQFLMRSTDGAIGICRGTSIVTWHAVVDDILEVIEVSARSREIERVLAIADKAAGEIYRFRGRDRT